MRRAVEIDAPGARSLRIDRHDRKAEEGSVDAQESSTEGALLLSRAVEEQTGLVGNGTTRVQAEVVRRDAQAAAALDAGFAARAVDSGLTVIPGQAGLAIIGLEVVVEIEGGAGGNGADVDLAILVAVP